MGYELHLVHKVETDEGGIAWQIDEVLQSIMQEWINRYKEIPDTVLPHIRLLLAIKTFRGDLLSLSRAYRQFAVEVGVQLNDITFLDAVTELARQTEQKARGEA